MKSAIGLLIGFALGAGCRFFDIPVPSPPKLLGALLVVATTIGYMTADKLLTKPADAAGARIYRSPVIRRRNKSSANCTVNVRMRCRSPRYWRCTEVTPAASASPTTIVPLGTFRSPASGPAAPVIESA